MSDTSNVWPFCAGTSIGTPGRRRVAERRQAPLRAEDSDLNRERQAADREDTVLAKRSLGGDHGAFDALVQRYHARIFTHLFRMVRNREEAEDLTQETFVRAFRFLRRYDTARPFRNWIYTIATNAGLNALRAQQRRSRVVASGVDANRPKGWDQREIAASRPPAADSSPQGESVAEAMNQLPPQAAMLVHLHYHEGMKIREAADVLGLSENAAKVALCRARKQLRLLLMEKRTP